MIHFKFNQFKWIKQHDSMQCGIACLSMICSYYKRDYSIETLSKYCFATTEGVSLLGMSKAANMLGFDTICGKLSVKQLLQVKLPCILHWNQNHFVVLYKVKNKFYIADPSKGLITYSLTDFCSHWIGTESCENKIGIAMILEPTKRFGCIKNDSTSKNYGFAFLFSYIKQFRKYFAQIILGLFVGCLLQLVMPFLTQAIVDIT